MIRTYRATAAAVVAFAAIQGGLAQTLNVTQYATHGNSGVNIQANWNVPSSWTCCDPDNMRWLQNVKLKNLDGTPKTNVAGYIDKPDFIDPLPSQPPGGWDLLPWYDVTYGSAADRTANTNRITNGSGRFFNDSPAGWAGPWGALDFFGYTAVVCINDTAKTASYLGGFSWGFRVAANGAVTKFALSAMGNNATTVGMFNTALQKSYSPATFSEWTVNVGDPNCQLTFNPVPEPGTIALCAAAVGVAAKRRRRRAA